MATIAKATFTKAIPKDAKLFEKKGRQFARFRHKGSMIDAPLTKKGDRCTIETAEWWVRYKNADGEWAKHKGYTDKAATTALAAKLEARAVQRREGLPDQFEEHTRRPISRHVDDFARRLDSKNNSEKHCVETEAKVRRIISGCKVGTIRDISASQVEDFLRQLRQGGMAVQTSNHYLRVIKTFSRWLKRDRRAADDPLFHLSMLNTSVDRRHDRRPLSDDEFAKLIHAAETGPVVETIPGPDRAMMYVLAAWTGYRRRELSSLTLRSFNLDGPTPSVRVTAAYTKNKRTDEIPLHAEVVKRLRAWVATWDEIDPDAPLFDLTTNGGCWRKTSLMMKRDLEAARAAWIEEAEKAGDAREVQRRESSELLTYENEDGLFADFHSNRHTFITNLGRAGVPLSTAQKLARHSDPKLTANVYTHLGVADKAAAIESLPTPPTAEPKTEPDTLSATGTDDVDTLPLDKGLSRIGPNRA